MLPYPNHGDVVPAVFCFRNNVVVRRRVQCCTCSWCRPSSAVLVNFAAEPLHCVAVKRASAKATVPRDVRPHAA
jgi:hypothetical protein